MNYYYNEFENVKFKMQVLDWPVMTTALETSCFWDMTWFSSSRKMNDSVSSTLTFSFWISLAFTGWKIKAVNRDIARFMFNIKLNTLQAVSNNARHLFQILTLKRKCKNCIHSCILCLKKGFIYFNERNKLGFIHKTIKANWQNCLILFPSKS